MTPVANLLDLDVVGAPLVVSSLEGEARAATPDALELLRRHTDFVDMPAPLPAELWAALDAVPSGRAIEWRPPRDVRHLLGCTRYPAGGTYLLIMNEISEKQVALSRRLHRQRLQATGRLVASIAHELRNAVTSIVYGADFLTMSVNDLPRENIRDMAREMVAAGRRLQFTVDGLLDYARLGPTVAVPVSLRDVMARALRMLRSVFVGGAHELVLDIPPHAEWVRGNPLTIEQIFVNLLINAVESTTDTVTITVSAAHVLPEGSGERAAELVRVRVHDDGPGIAESIRRSVFDEFFTTREHGTGLGLSNAREAAESLGGMLYLDEVASGACFSVLLPRGDAT